MNKSLIKNFREIHFKRLDKNFFIHNLKQDFHLIAIPYKKQNFIIEELYKWKVIKLFSLNYKKLEYSKIVFGKIFYEKILIYLVIDPAPKYRSLNNYYSKKYINIKSKDMKDKIERNFIDFFITTNPKEFLEKYSLLFGIGALKYLENNEDKLNKLKPLSKPLGYLGWKNFNEFISFANISCDWIVLRNFEFLPYKFSENDKDIDILCRDKKLFIRKLNLKKRSWGISSYQVNIGNKKIPVDLRFIGDGYFDKLWEENILRNKIFQNNLVPRPSNLDYFYSLIYHSKLQKNKVKQIYSERLDYLKLTLEMHNLKKSFIYNDLITSKILSDFMNFNKYNISEPIDKSVEINYYFLKQLKNNIDIINNNEIPLLVKFVLRIPLPLRNFIFKLKKYLILNKKNLLK